MTDSPVSAISKPTPLPEVAVVKSIVSSVKSYLGNLNDTFDTLARQTVQMPLSGGDLKTNKLQTGLKRALKMQETKHTASVEDVKVLLVKEMRDKVEQDLRLQIEKAVEDQVDEIVKEHVAASLEMHIPRELQDELAENKKQLERLLLRLHNSESRRKNGLLKASDKLNPLHTIYKTDGDISLHFPKTLDALSALDAETAKTLVREYQIPDVSESRLGNINRFMRFCGVAYQVVSALCGDFENLD